MPNSSKEKKLRTNIKSAQGSFALAEILTVIYILIVCFSKNFLFYFSTFGTEFILKSSSFATNYPGSLPLVLTIVLVALYNAVFIAVAAIANKKPELLWLGLAVYSIDTVWMIVGYATQYLEPFTAEKWIDVILHGFILLFLAVGTDSVVKLKKLESKPKIVHRKKHKKKKK